MRFLCDIELIFQIRQIPTQIAKDLFVTEVYCLRNFQYET